jgi:hypothetical protein
LSPVAMLGVAVILSCVAVRLCHVVVVVVLPTPTITVFFGEDLGPLGASGEEATRTFTVEAEG